MPKRRDLIVNCTSVGMVRGPDENGAPLLGDQIPSTALVNDLVYNPKETPLLREAEAAGANTLGGIYMLVYQGASAFEMWTGKPAPVSVMLEGGGRRHGSPRLKSNLGYPPGNFGQTNRNILESIRRRGTGKLGRPEISVYRVS